MKKKNHFTALILSTIGHTEQQAIVQRYLRFPCVFVAILANVTHKETNVHLHASSVYLAETGAPE